MRLLFIIPILFLLLPVFGQEVYPAQSPCFCVPTIELGWEGTSQKQDKIELTRISIGFNANLPTATYYDSTFVRDIDNPAWSSTDYYNQAINDTISMRIRRIAVGLKPQLGTEDDIGYVFNTRTKDRPNFLTPNECDAAVGTNVALNHQFRVMLAIETVNANYRQGSPWPPDGSNITTHFSIAFDCTAGMVTNSVDVQFNGPRTNYWNTYGCKTNCASRWGTNTEDTNFSGYFTEKSLSKIWRNNRNSFKMNNAGFWPGQIPYTGYLEKANRRCQTFASFTCSDLDSTRNNIIADRIIDNKVKGQCMPVCGTCEALGRGYWNFRPYILCPSPSNGTLEYIIPNGANMTGTWCFMEAAGFPPFVCGTSGTLPATTITINNSIDDTKNGIRYYLRLTTTNPACTIYDTVQIFSASYTDPNCSLAPPSGVGFISNIPVAKSCLGNDRGYLGNAFVTNSGVDSIAGFFGSSLPYKKYIEYQNINQADPPNAAGNIMYEAYAKKGTLIATYNFAFPDPVCPCTRNRYIVFNKAYHSTTGFGISAWRKTALENLGWTVLP